MAEPTAYIVLRAASAATDDNPNADWRELEGVVRATTAEAAIRAAVTKLDPTVQGGTYLAVPHRSYRPVTVSAVQTTVLKLDPQ